MEEDVFSSEMRCPCRMESDDEGEVSDDAAAAAAVDDDNDDVVVVVLAGGGGEKTNILRRRPGDFALLRDDEDAGRL